MALAKVDSKGRVNLPPDIREMLGDFVELKPVSKYAVLIERAKSSRKKGTESISNFVKLIDKEPKRTGKPENPSPEAMKSIWSE